MLKHELAQLEQNNKDLQSIPKNKKRALTPFFYKDFNNSKDLLQN